MPMVPPSAAAKKAEARAMLRMLPPAIRRTVRARAAKSTPAPTGASSGKITCQMRLRSASSGNGNSMQLHAAHEGLIHVVPHIGGQDGDALVLLHLLQQVADFDVGVAVVGIFHLRALAEQRVGFVEKENRIAVLGLVEDSVEILLRLPDVLADNRARGRSCRHRAAARWPGLLRPSSCRCPGPRKEDIQAAAERQDAVETPLVVNERTESHMAGDFTNCSMRSAGSTIRPRYGAAELLRASSESLVWECRRHASYRSPVPSSGVSGWPQPARNLAVAAASRISAPLKRNLLPAPQIDRRRSAAIECGRPQLQAFGVTWARELHARERRSADRLRASQGAAPERTAIPESSENLLEDRLSQLLLVIAQERIEAIPVGDKTAQARFPHCETHQLARFHQFHRRQPLSPYHQQAGPGFTAKRFGGRLLPTPLAPWK